MTYCKNAYAYSWTDHKWKNAWIIDIYASVFFFFFAFPSNKGYRHIARAYNLAKILGIILRFVNVPFHQLHDTPYLPRIDSPCEMNINTLHNRSSFLACSLATGNLANTHTLCVCAVSHWLGVYTEWSLVNLNNGSKEKHKNSSTI